MRGSREASPLIFIIFHFSSRRNPSLPYTRTATKRIFDDSAHFYLSLLKSADQKGRIFPAFLHIIKFSPAN